MQYLLTEEEFHIMKREFQGAIEDLKHIVLELRKEIDDIKPIFDECRYGCPVEDSCTFEDKRNIICRNKKEKNNVTEQRTKGSI